jgi:lipopolysaccharide biosynthesis regulator YciM
MIIGITTDWRVRIPEGDKRGNLMSMYLADEDWEDGAAEVFLQKSTEDQNVELAQFMLDLFTNTARPNLEGETWQLIRDHIQFIADNVWVAQR